MYVVVDPTISRPVRSYSYNSSEILPHTGSMLWLIQPYPGQLDHIVIIEVKYYLTQVVCCG